MIGMEVPGSIGHPPVPEEIDNMAESIDEPFRPVGFSRIAVTGRGPASLKSPGQGNQFPFISTPKLIITGWPKVFTWSAQSVRN